MHSFNSRRKFLINTTLFSSTVIFNSCYGFENEFIGHGDFKFRVDKQWGNQDPLKYPVDHCHEMVMDNKNRVILTTTHAKNNILIYDRSGKILNNWSIGYNGAHGLTISDEGGEEFLFITDPDNNKFCKSTLDGKIIFEKTYPIEISDYTNSKQFKPTETVIADNGDIYVCDGYGLDYIIQYNRNGEYIRHFGGHGTKDDLFNCCHGITIDNRDPKKQTLLITSRTSNQFKRFTMDGKWIETVNLPGCYICRPVIKDKYLLFAVIITKDWSKYDGMIAILDKNNKVISMPGGNVPCYDNNAFLPPIYDNKTFYNPHDLCVDNDWNIYVPQWNSGKTYPMKLSRV
jgi:peptidylamidoglycolate lyase